MEFWGVEVKSGQPLEVSPGDGRILHILQACLGEKANEANEQPLLEVSPGDDIGLQHILEACLLQLKKGKAQEMKKEKANDSVYLYVTVQGKKLVLGTLFVEKLPQQHFNNLVFDKDFEISHNSKSGSVYFYGYLASATEQPGDIEKMDTDDEDYMDVGECEDEDDSDDSDDSDDASVESEEEKPKKKKAQTRKKITTKTPLTDKKAKVTPQITGSESVESEEETPKKADKSKKKRKADSASFTPLAKKADKSKKKRKADSASFTPLAKKANVTPQKTGDCSTKAKHSAGN